jgi:metal-responsive CopG/Arc/MetJ family transcriptional regulator
MGGAAKIAISVEPELLRRLEQVRRRSGESRSAAIARAIRLLTHAEEQAQRVDEYRSAYQRIPETDDDVAGARASARRSLRAVAWDE